DYGDLAGRRRIYPQTLSWHSRREVGRPEDARLFVKIGMRFLLRERVIAQRDNVDSGALKERVAYLASNPQPARRVLGVDNYEIRMIFATQTRGYRQRHFAARLADHVADEQYAHLRLRFLSLVASVRRAVAWPSYRR